MLRRRRGDRDEAGVSHYKMRQNLVSIGDDFWIENERGQRVFRVDGKALRVRQTLAFEDASGHEICKIQERMLRVRDSMEIEGPGGERMAMVKKQLISPIRDRWQVKIGDGPDMEVHGNIVDHEYSFERGGQKVAEVSKKWFRLRDTYGVEVAPGQNEAVVLATTVAIDMMANPER
jgi:uncharacterized protein YxjI